MTFGRTRFAAPTDKCSKCGAKNWTEVTYSDTVHTRGLDVDVEGLRKNYCSECRHTWVTQQQRQHNDEQIRSAFLVARDKAREQDGLLAGDDISYIREKFGLSQREASFIFGGGVNSFNKYESGEVLQSQAMDRLLRLTNEVGGRAVQFLRICKGAPIGRVVVKPVLDSVIDNSVLNAEAGRMAVNKISFSARYGESSQLSVDCLYHRGDDQMILVNRLPEKQNVAQEKR